MEGTKQTPKPYQQPTPQYKIYNEYGAKHELPFLDTLVKRNRNGHLGRTVCHKSNKRYDNTYVWLVLVT